MNNQNGAIAILSAIMLIMLLGFAAFSIDTGHLMVTKNELQNAADAGALAGANALFSLDGKKIEPGCNQIAYNTAIENDSVKMAVEVTWNPGDNTGSDVERGHWSFTTGEFTAVDDTTFKTDLWGKDAAALDIDLTYVNAVRVKVRRESTPIPSFFARIFGYNDFQQTAIGTAYVGFAGTFAPGEVNFPIALCEDVVYPTGVAGEDPICTETIFYEKDETAMWTNLEQPNQTPDPKDKCDTSPASELKDLVGPIIHTGNPYSLVVGEGMGGTNGADNSVLMKAIPEWKIKSTNPDGSRKVVRATLPVADCSDNTCITLKGAVEVQILWMIRKKATNEEEYEKAPYNYYDADILKEDGSFHSAGAKLFTSTEPNAELRMLAFIDKLKLPTKDEKGNDVDKRTFFKLQCGTAIPKGGPGGINSGIHASRAVLVK